MALFPFDSQAQPPDFRRSDVGPEAVATDQGGTDSSRAPSLGADAPMSDLTAGNDDLDRKKQYRNVR